MSKSQQQKGDAPETVLLRHPLPKYSFQARKLPKETSPKSSEKSPNSDPVKPQTAGSTHKDSSLTKEGSTGNGLDKKSATVRPLPAAPKLEPFTAKPVTKPTATVLASKVQSVLENSGRKSCLSADDKDADLNSLVAAALSREKRTSHTEATPASISANPQTTGSEIGTLAPPSFLPASTAAASANIPVPDAGLLAHTVEGPNEAEKLKKAEEEIQMLKSQLDVQLQVNAELKRLLVASVGEDLERRMENLARDRAQLAMELGDFTKKMTEDYENLDQISIQADMWRTKYLASRVMVEELASGRAFYSAQFHDSQQAMQQMLNERYELRAQMLQAYKCLQQVKEAFDPLNTHRAQGLTSTNVLDLSKTIKQLSEAVRFRLIPAHAGSRIIMPLEDTMESTMTNAEVMAYELLSKQATPPTFKHSVPAALTTRSSKAIERFHPQVRQDNLTMNCCSHCKGEIKIA